MAGKRPELDFAALVTSIRETDAQLLTQAIRSVNLGLTLRNWAIGFHIAEFELRGADRAAYGDRLLSELAKALGDHGISNTGRRQLYQYLAFYRAYPQIVRTVPAQFRALLPASAPSGKVPTVSAQSGLPPQKLLASLSYSHFELLVRREDPLARSFYEVGWSSTRSQICQIVGSSRSISSNYPPATNSRSSSTLSSNRSSMRDAAEGRAASGLTPSRFVQGGLAQFASDKPTIGLLPCRSKDSIVVEYALRDLKKPIGVAG